MPRHRKPTNLLLLNGAIDHDPKRYANRTQEPKPTGDLGAPPAHFEEQLTQIWNELVEQVPPGVLTSADRFILEITCSLTLKMRNLTISTGETTQLISCLGRLGLTPADRSRVTVDPSVSTPLIPESKFAKFANKP